jgi:2,4-didehydro-3-deoxy-L-rhamnonate hydrolase
MRFVTFCDGLDEWAGVLCEDRVIPLYDNPGGLVDLIVAGTMALDYTRAKLAVSRDRGLPLAEVELLSPLRRFDRDILCTEWNAEQPEHPAFFTKRADTVIGPYDDIAYDPPVSANWDCKAELAVVIGRLGREIPHGAALDHVWGYTLANSSATMPVGPCVVTPDEVGEPEEVRLQCVVNGEVRQDTVIGDLALDVAGLISELSFVMTLRPGDLLLTGTPAGVPQVFLADGDEVLVRCDRIGELKNRVVHWDLATPTKGERP